MKNAIRFRIETLINIARLTDDRMKREALLNTAYEMLDGMTTVTAYEINPTYQYIVDNIEPDSMQKIKRTDLYEEYEKRMIAMNDTVVSRNDFYTALLSCGIKQRMLHGYRYFMCRYKEGVNISERN